MTCEASTKCESSCTAGDCTSVWFKLKSVFEKLPFRDGLVWTLGGLTVEMKLCFQISPIVVCTRVSFQACD